MKQRLLLGGLGILLVGTLVLLITGSMRVVAGPLFVVFSMLQFAFDSIPQRLLWFGMLALAVPVIWRSIIPRARMLGPQERVVDPVVGGRVGEWLEAMENARETVYQKWELAQQLRQLVLQVLSEREGLPPQQIWRLENGSLAIPPEVLGLLHAPRILTPAQQRHARTREVALEQQVTATVAYLHDQLTTLAGADQ